jgi:hypothetical protein
MSDMRLGSIGTISDYFRGLKAPASLRPSQELRRLCSKLGVQSDPRPRDGQKMSPDLIDPSYHLGSTTTWASARYVRIAN